MKKLLIIGSSTIHTYNYINLVQDYFDEILLLSHEKNENSTVNTRQINFRLGLNIFNSIKKIKKIVKEFNPSIIHIHQANSYAFISTLALKNSTIPQVLTAWGSDILINPRKSMILKKMLIFSLRSIDKATSDSMYMASEMKIYNSNLDIKIVNFGIDVNGKKVDKENIIYSNRSHNTLYNIDKVIYSFYKFVQLNSDWRLVVGATGKNTTKLKQLVKSLNIEDKVEFIGWVDSKINNKMYQKSKIYVSIPSSDATSISLLEAISNDCICFVSNLPANGEHILDSINGFIEPCLESIDFKKYDTIHQELLEKVNSIRKINYLKDTNKKKFLSIYDELLKKGRNENNTIS